jgi:hypothetical protein
MAKKSKVSRPKIQPPELFLYIPCKVDGPKENEVVPVLVTYTNKSGVVSARYECPYCGQRFYRRVPCVGHMGGTPNRPASCRVLFAQDCARRIKPKLDLLENGPIRMKVNGRNVTFVKKD